MADWAEFALAFAVFLVTHSVPIRPPLRPILIARLGPRGPAGVEKRRQRIGVLWFIHHPYTPGPGAGRTTPPPAPVFHVPRGFPPPPR